MSPEEVQTQLASLEAACAAKDAALEARVADKEAAHERMEAAALDSQEAWDALFEFIAKTREGA